MSKPLKKFKFIKKTECFIDGLTFPEPKSFGNYTALGFWGLLIILTLPFWILPYAFGKLIKLISGRRIIRKMFYICPNCGDKIKYEQNHVQKIECDCGWYSYLDNEIEREGKPMEEKEDYEM